jgi:hypothetical protein
MPTFRRSELPRGRQKSAITVSSSTFNLRSLWHLKPEARLYCPLVLKFRESVCSEVPVRGASVGRIIDRSLWSYPKLAKSPSSMKVAQTNLALHSSFSVVSHADRFALVLSKACEASFIYEGLVRRFADADYVRNWLGSKYHAQGEMYLGSPAPRVQSAVVCSTVLATTIRQA